MTHASSERPRVRRGFRRFAILAFILMVPFAVHAAWDFIEVRRLVREVEAIKAKGEPLTEREAGHYYAGTTPEHERASREYLAAAMLAMHHRYQPEMGNLHEWVIAGVPLEQPVDDVRNRLKATVEDAQDALRLADIANSREFKGFTPGTEYSYRTQGLASLSRLLSSRTIHLALSGEGDAAVDAALQSLRFRRVRGQVRWLSLMISGAAELPLLLSTSSPSSDSLGRLQTAIAAAEAQHDIARDIAAQRAWAVEMIWERYYGSDPAVPTRYLLPFRSVSEWALRPWFTHRVVEMLRHWADLVDAARKPWPEKATAMAEVQRRRGAGSDSVPSGVARRASGGLFHAFGFVGGLQLGTDALILDRCNGAAVAVERFRRGHQGALPRTLDELVPTYLPAAPTDPLSGKHLLFRTDGKSYSIYSVGADAKDDGGDLASELHEVIKRGWGRRNLRGKDVGVRILIH